MNSNIHQSEEMLGYFCKLCMAPMERDAVICQTCHNPQNWRRHVNPSSTMLALILAGMSIFVMSLSMLSALADRPRSRVSISQFYEDNGKMYITVTNLGEMPAIIESFERVQISSNFFYKLNIQDTESKFRKTGVERIEVIPGIEVVGENSDQISRIAAAENLRFVLRETEMKAQIINYDESRENVSFKISKELIYRDLHPYAVGCFDSLTDERKLKSLDVDQEKICSFLVDILIKYDFGSNYNHPAELMPYYLGEEMVSR